MFLRRFFVGTLGHRELRLIVSPKGQGSACQFVLERYATEVQAHRSQAYAQKSLGLVVMVDADNCTVRERLKQLDERLTGQGMSARGDLERMVLQIPKWEIQTWVRHLCSSQPVEEDQQYPVFDRDECQVAVERLRQLLTIDPLPEETPPSLRVGIVELRRLPTS
jgi:hypothetical protein